MEIRISQYPDEYYTSRVEEINSDNLVLAMPMTKGYPVMLPIGSSFTGKVIVDGVVYQFNSFLISKKVHPLPVWVVSIPSELKKIQLRSFVRISVQLPVKVSVINTKEQTVEEAALQSDNPPLSLYTKDISGGGVQIVTKQSIPVGTMLQLLLDVPSCGSIPVVGEVVRIEQPQPDTYIYWLGVKFLNIQEKDRSKLIQYIFKKQLEQRQKGVH